MSHTNGQRPVYGQDGRYLGSAASGPCVHDQLVQTGKTCSEECCDIYRCLRCDEEIRVELPE